MSEEDTCEECGAILEYDDFITEPDGVVECWGAMVPMPPVTTGYTCPNCGHQGEY